MKEINNIIRLQKSIERNTLKIAEEIHKIIEKSSRSDPYGYIAQKTGIRKRMIQYYHSIHKNFIVTKKISLRDAEVLGFSKLATLTSLTHLEKAEMQDFLKKNGSLSVRDLAKQVKKINPNRLKTPIAEDKRHKASIVLKVSKSNRDKFKNLIEDLAEENNTQSVNVVIKKILEDYGY